MKFLNFTFEGGRRQTMKNLEFEIGQYESDCRRIFFFSGLEDIFVWLFCVTTGEH